MKHGPENIFIDVIEVCDEPDLGVRECHWIAFYSQSGYDLLNMSEGGECGGGGGYVMSAATRAKLSRSMSERVISAETKQKQSDAKRGENHPNFGKTLSPETKRKIGIANKGRKPSEKSIESLRKYSEQGWTDQHRVNLSAARMGNTNARRSAHSRHINKGVHISETCKICKEEANEATNASG